MNTRRPGAPRAGLLLSATLLLLVKQVRGTERPGRMAAIHQHLRMLAEHPEVDAMVRDTCLALAEGLGAAEPAGPGMEPAGPRGPLH